MQGAEVRCAYSGKEGIDQAVSWKAHVALIDIGLPDMAGYEVARRIREKRGSRTLLFAVTGFNDPKSMSQAGEAGFAEWLVKPIEPRELHALVMSHLETSQSGPKKTRE
jgi:two-component system CheB/CheR fusion protein